MDLSGPFIGQITVLPFFVDSWLMVSEFS